jgi:hypothetical protein
VTDRHNGYYVVLENDIRSDDAEATIAAIKQIKGVLSVTPNVASFDEHIAEMRVRTELGDKIMRLLHPDWYKDR